MYTLVKENNALQARTFTELLDQHLSSANFSKQCLIAHQDTNIWHIKILLRQKYRDTQTNIFILIVNIYLPLDAYVA